MSGIHEVIQREYEDKFDLLADALIREAEAYAYVAGQPHRPRDRDVLWGRIAESARSLHRHIVEHAVFGFALPDVEDGCRLLLTAALDFAASTFAVDAILDTPEAGGWGDNPLLSAAGAEVIASGEALERAVLDAFGFAEEVSP